MNNAVESRHIGLQMSERPANEVNENAGEPEKDIAIDGSGVEQSTVPNSKMLIVQS